MQQIIGKRFVYSGKKQANCDEIVMVCKALPNSEYLVVTLDGLGFSVSEKLLFENYTAIKPSHVITYHKTKTWIDSRTEAANLIITVAKYSDKDEEVILSFNLLNWLMDVLAKKDKDAGWHVRNREFKNDYQYLATPLDSNNSSVWENEQEDKEIYYCYLDSVCHVPAITGMIPTELIPYLYGKDNKLENYNDALSILDISVKDLVALNNINDLIFYDIEFTSNILHYLGYIDVQFYYDQIVKKDILWTADKFLEEKEFEQEWNKTMLNQKSKTNAYLGIPYLSLQGVDFNKPVTYRKRTETDDEIEKLRQQLAENGEFLMQYYFTADNSILLVTYVCNRPIDDKPAFTDEEMTKFLKSKR